MKKFKYVVINMYEVYVDNSMDSYWSSSYEDHGQMTDCVVELTGEECNLINQSGRGYKVVRIHSAEDVYALLDEQKEKFKKNKVTAKKAAVKRAATVKKNKAAKAAKKKEKELAEFKKLKAKYG